MFTKILADIGIGIGIFFVIMFVTALISRQREDYIVGDNVYTNRYTTGARGWWTSMLILVGIIVYYLHLNGAPLLKTLGISALVIIPAEFIFNIQFAIHLEKRNNIDSSESIEQASMLSFTINSLATSVFAVLIINKLGWI